MLRVLVFISFGLFIEFAFRLFLARKYLSINAKGLPHTSQAENLTSIDKLVAIIAKELPGILGLFIFFCTSYFSFFAFIGTEYHFIQLFFLAVLISITLIRAFAFISSLIFSPSLAAFRLLPMQCKSSNTIHRLIIWAAGYIISAMMLSILAHRFGAENSTVYFIQLFFATLLLLTTALIVIIFRNRVKEQILAPESESAPNTSWAIQQVAAIWHIPALLYLFVLWLLLVNDVTDVEQKNRSAFILSFFVLPIWMVADRIMQWVVQYATGILKIHQEEDDNDLVDETELAHRQQGRKLYLKIRGFVRVGLVFILSIWVASLWNIRIPFLSNLMPVLLDTLIILCLALLFWQFISSWIQRKIEESLPDSVEEDEQQDDEWGAASARGRSYTLLPMIRRFIATILVVMVSMTILSAMGVDIGPLLAGAGVIGIAIGFGAQKLVSDMFSGFFYLLDDAFRVGEYMTAGNVSGMVENITLRNVMLRHHRGMLQIIPHSDLGAITNYMRGGIVVKFNLDFPYDADIDKIRKIIKKVGQAMLNDEELGKDFIRPVKSQGVREISNSVMTIRVKFTAQPGTHFVIRREAYKRITEALHAKGIHYAHKKVIVDIPAQADEPATEEQIRNINQAAGAAALEAMDEVPESKEQKKPLL